MAPSKAQAQAPNYSAVERWIDALLAELRQGGATRAERGAVSVDNSGGFAVTGLTVEWQNGMQLSLERLVGEGIATGARFTARRLRAEGVAFMVDTWRLETARIELEGLDLPALAAADVLGRGTAGLPAIIRELNLARASMQALTMRNATGGTHLEASLRDVSVTGVNRGIASRVGYGGASVVMRDSGSPPAVTIELGAVAIETADLVLEAETLVPPANASRERRVAYARVTSAGANVDVGGVKFTLGPIDMVNVRSRVPREGYLDMWRFTSQLEGQGGTAPSSPEQLRRLISFLQDALDLTEVERLTIGPSRMDAMGQITIGRIEARNLTPASFGSVVISDVQVQSPRRVRHSIGSITLSDVDFGRAFIAFLEIGFEAQGGGQPNMARMENNLPRIGAIELRDVMLGIQGREGPVQVALGNLAFAMGQWRGLVPDSLLLNVSGLRLPASLVRLSAGLPNARQLGIETVDVGSQIELRLDTAARTATLRPGRVAANGLGAVVLEMTFEDVDISQLGVAGFTDPTRLLQQASLRELRVRIENDGLIQRVMGATQADLQQALAAVAPLVGNLIQDAGQRERAVEALQAFGREQRSLTLVITPRGRLSAMDVLTATQSREPPLQLLSQLNLTLSAND